MTDRQTAVKLPYMDSDAKSVKLTVKMDAREMAKLRRLAASEHAGLSQTVRLLIHRATEASEKKRTGT